MYYTASEVYMAFTLDSKVKNILNEIGSTVFQGKVSQDKVCLYCKNGVYWETSMELLLSGANCDCLDCNPEVLTRELRASQRKADLVILKSKLSDYKFSMISPSTFDSLNTSIVVICTNGIQRSIIPKKFINAPLYCDCRSCTITLPKYYSEESIANLHTHAQLIGYTITTDFENMLQGATIDAVSECGSNISVRPTSFFNRYRCDCLKCLSNRITKIRNVETTTLQTHIAELQKHIKKHTIPPNPPEQIELIVKYNSAFCRVKSRIPAISHTEFLKLIDYRELTTLYEGRNGMTVDHIIPFKHFPKQNDLIIVDSLAWQLDNLRYLQVQANVTRSSNISDEDFEIIASNDLLFTIFCGVVLKRFDVNSVMNTILM
jgi:hypothetical protein